MGDDPAGRSGGIRMRSCTGDALTTRAIREPTITWLFAGSGSEPLPVIVIWLPAPPEPALRPLHCGAGPVGFCERTKNGAMSTSVACWIPAGSRTCANRRNGQGEGVGLGGREVREALGKGSRKDKRIDEARARGIHDRAAGRQRIERSRQLQGAAAVGVIENVEGEQQAAIGAQLDSGAIA